MESQPGVKPQQAELDAWAEYTDVTDGIRHYCPERVDPLMPIERFVKLQMPGIGLVPETRKDFEKIIETPALEAVLNLYDKNIRTLSNNANSETVGGRATITIDWNSLSAENKRVAEGLGLAPSEEDNFGFRPFDLGVPVSEVDTVNDVSEALFTAQQPFVRQDVLYGFNEVTDSYLDRLAERLIGYEKFLSSNSPTIEEALSIISVGAVYYRPENRVYANQELLNKHIEYLERTE